MADELTTQQQLDAANAKIAEYEKRLAIEPTLQEKLQALSTEQLTVTVGDALMEHLGHHPKMWAYWQVLRDRILPPPPTEQPASDASTTS